MTQLLNFSSKAVINSFMSASVIILVNHLKRKRMQVAEVGRRVVAKLYPHSTRLSLMI